MLIHKTRQTSPTTARNYQTENKEETATEK